MALQIILTPLKEQATFAAAWTDAFVVSEHQGANGNDGHSSYALETSNGSKFEGMLMADALHLEVSSTDLIDISFQETVFDLAARHQCVVSSDDAPVAVVLDANLVDAAAISLKCENNQIEKVYAAYDLFDALFGPMETEISSPALGSDLEAFGLQIDADDNHKASLKLANGGVLDVDPDEHLSWEATQGVTLGLSNPRFARVMSGWSTDLRGPLAELDPRRMRQDVSGYIFWSGHLPFQQYPATIETAVLGTYDKPMQLDRLLIKLQDCSSHEMLAREAFGGPLEAFVFPTEGLRVFLFLMAEAGHTSDIIFDIYQALVSKGATFHTSKCLNPNIIEAYLAFHAMHLEIDPEN